MERQNKPFSRKPQGRSDSQPDNGSSGQPLSQRPSKVRVWVSPDAAKTPPQETSSLNPSNSLSKRATRLVEPPVTAADDEGGSIHLLVTAPPEKPPVWSQLLVLLLWMGGAGAIAAAGWLAFWLMINPGSVRWLSWLMPAWHQTALVRDDIPRSMADLEQEAAQQGLELGKPILLNRSVEANFRDILVPVLIKDCPTGSQTCGQITELHVYRSTSLEANTEWRVIDRLGVSGPDEYFVLSPLADATTTHRGSLDAMPLNNLTTMEGTAPGGGIWFLLSGERGEGSGSILYGQLGRYDGRKSRISLEMPWSSPAGQPPRWQTITGSKTSELVLNQTVGLEPQYAVWQVRSQPTNLTTPVHFLPISLEQSALDDAAYDNALLLARSGLWMPAQQLLESLKRRWGGDWTASAQAQLDVIGLHANFTRAQAKRTWASPAEQITVQIIDGNWQKTMELMRSAFQDGYDLSTLLNGNPRLWERVEAALKVSPSLEVQTVGGLFVYARQGRAAAIAWLQQQNQISPQSLALHPRTQQILRLLDSTPVAQTSLPSSPGRLLGEAIPIGSATQNWKTADDKPFQLSPGQTAYRIQVTRFETSQGWQRSPLRRSSNALTPRYLWHLMGLQTNANLQLMTWRDDQLQILNATVQAVRLVGGVPELLAVVAAGDISSVEPGLSSAPMPLLSATPTTLQWVQPDRTITLEDLHQQQPTWTNAVMTTLMQQLPQPTLSVSTNSSEVNLQAIGSWAVQLIDLTGDGQSEAIATIRPTETAPPQTVILSSTGSLIYSSVNGQMVAIADLQDGNPPSLVVRDRSRFSLKRWSSRNQRFE
jgi:hypothetical protein